jgi:hypothetical protein
MSSVFQGPTTAPTPRLSLKAMANSDFIGLALFSALGLLISLYMIVRYPEIGAIIAQVNQ